MATEPIRTYRLVRKGEPGLTCDAEGVALGGVPLVSASAHADGGSRWQVRRRDEIGDILELGYGRQEQGVVDRCHRGLRRVAAQLEAGDLALAAMEALMLRLPDLDPEGMAKLAAAGALRKDGDAWMNEPRVSAGQSDGGQWTTGGGTSSVASNGASAGSEPGAGGKPPRDDHSAPAASDLAPEIIVTSPVHQSRRPNANGFFPTSEGGGVFYIPTVVRGQQVRDTEIIADDANAYHVGWNDGVISLKDAKGNVVQVKATTPDEVHAFNTTTGRALGVSIETFPDTPLGTPNAPPTAEEQRQFDQESAAFAEGKRESEQSWSGQLTTQAVELDTQLLFLDTAPSPGEVPVAGALNTAEELWPRGTEEIAAEGARPTVQGNAYEIGIRGLYPETTAEARRFGEFGQYKADAVADVFGKWTAIDAKYVDEWGSSIRNPESAIGDKPFSIEAQEEMVDQAKRYDEYFDGGSIYHTNSLDLASYYYRLFRASGVTKARFIITPAGP